MAENEKGTDVATLEEGDEIKVELVDTSVALTAVERAGFDIQVTTAKQHPRSITKSIREALSLATLDQETATGCFYVLPRAGKRIEGPSARLAEIMAYAWGNLRADSQVMGEDATHVTAVGTCFDLERNVAVRVQVKRRITNKQGKRYDEDMIGVTGNAAISIALRNAVFKVIPAALTQQVYQAARKASIGEASTITQTRQNAMEWFAKAGLPAEEVFRLLNVKGLDDVGVDEIITLRGLMTAIKDGETSVESLLAHGSDSGELKARTQEKAEKLKERLGANAEPPAPDKEADQFAAGIEKALKAARMPKDVRSHFKKLLKELWEAGDIDGLKELSVKVEREAEKGKKKD